MLVARPGGKYARRETVTPEELPRIPLVLRESGSGTLEVIAAALAARGIRLSQFDVTMRLGSTEGIKAFVRNSDAMAIVSVISVVDELRSGALRIVDALPRFRFRACRSRTCASGAAVHRLRPGGFLIAGPRFPYPCVITSGYPG